MKRENFVTLQGWMYELPLKDIKEVVLFAIIYGFSQDGKSKFYGSFNYIAKMIKSNRRTAITKIQRLVDAGLIQKIEGENGNVNAYYVDLEKLQMLLNAQSSGEIIAPYNGLAQDNGDKIASSGAKIAPTSGAKIAPKKYINKNNIYNSGTSFVSSGSNEPSEQTTSYASQEKSKPDNPLNSKKVKKYNMASAENFNADGEKVGEPTPKEGKARTKLFRNSIYSDYARLVERFKKMPEQRRIKYRGLDLDWYIEAVENWSEKKQVKRTDEGWFRTILDFMRRDMAEGKAQWLKGHNPNERKNDSLYD